MDDKDLVVATLHDGVVYCPHERPEGEGRYMICEQHCKSRLKQVHLDLLASLTVLTWKTPRELKKGGGDSLAGYDLATIARYLARLSTIMLVVRRERERAHGLILWEYSLNPVFNFGKDGPRRFPGIGQLGPLGPNGVDTNV